MTAGLFAEFFGEVMMGVESMEWWAHKLDVDEVTLVCWSGGADFPTPHQLVEMHMTLMTHQNLSGTVRDSWLELTAKPMNEVLSMGRVSSLLERESMQVIIEQEMLTQVTASLFKIGSFARRTELLKRFEEHCGVWSHYR